MKIFRPRHGLDHLPVAETPEIALASGTTLQVPLILRNDSNQPAEISIRVNLPEGWIEKDKPVALFAFSGRDSFSSNWNWWCPKRKPITLLT
jgi:hypothetical protein